MFQVNDYIFLNFHRVYYGYFHLIHYILVFSLFMQNNFFLIYFILLLRNCMGKNFLMLYIQLIFIYNIFPTAGIYFISRKVTSAKEDPFPSFPELPH